MFSAFKIPFSKWYVHTHRWTTKQRPTFEAYNITHEYGGLVEHYFRIGQIQFIITTLPF